MTKEEAVSIIEERIRVTEYVESSYVDCVDIEALRIAIKALQQPEITRCCDCRYYIPYDWMFDGLSRSSNINDYSQDEIGCAVNDHKYLPEGFCSRAERRTDA